MVIFISQLWHNYNLNVRIDIVKRVILMLEFFLNTKVKKVIKMNLECLEFNGKIVEKGHKDYSEAILSWNRAIKAKPSAILYCYNEDDVICAINFVNEKNLEFRIRSGGHNYEGYSTGDNLIVIDVSNLKEVIIDEKNKRVTFGGGVRNEEAYEALGNKNYPFSGGGCPSVGIVGLILGGGWGYSSRYFGLACDSLIEVTLINNKGEKIIVNKDKNEDLFWALKGIGGGNIGVVTSVTLGLEEKVDKGTLIRLNYKNISKDIAIKTLNVLQELYEDLDNRINIKTAMYNSEEYGIGIKFTGLFYGNKKECELILKPLLEIADLIEDKDIELDYQSILDCNRIIQFSHPDYESYKSTGRLLYKKLNKNEIKKLYLIIKNKAEGSVYSAITLYGLGGNIKNIKNDETAVSYRNAKFILGFQSVWEEDDYEEVNKDWIVENFKFINSITEGSFVNFPLKELSNYEEEYYGDNLNRLRKIKKKYDENNFFKFPQVVTFNRD